MAPPGCPDFACSTIDADRIRMLSAALFMIAFSFIKISVIFELLYLNYKMTQH